MAPCNPARVPPTFEPVVPSNLSLPEDPFAAADAILPTHNQIATGKDHIMRPAARAGVPKPGPATLSANAHLDEWLEEAKQCHYLPEPVMKELCEMVKEVLMEGTCAADVPPVPHCYWIRLE